MVTIKDVARLSGVSPTTVSHVVNNASRAVNKQTRERVLRAVKSLDYHPSAVARALVRGRTDTLGLIQASGSTAFITDSYYAPMIRGVLDVSLLRHQMITLFVGNEWSNAEQSMPIYRDGRCDGLLLATSPTYETGLIPALLATGIPFVLAGGQDADPRVSSVDSDSETAAFALVTHLVELGHRRIGVLDWAPYNNYSVGLRVVGYNKALEAAGIARDEDLFLSGCYHEQDIRDRVDYAMSLAPGKRPTALFAADDELALTVIRMLKEKGLRVPEDISVAGFDDRPSAAAADPPLTTVRQFPHTIGERATEMLLDRIENGTPGGEKVFTPHELMIRESACPPNSSPV